MITCDKFKDYYMYFEKTKTGMVIRDKFEDWSWSLLNLENGSVEYADAEENN